MRYLAPALLAATLAATPSSAADVLPYPSLAAWLADVKGRIPGEGSEAFVAPDAAELAEFTTCFGRLLDARADAATACLDRHGYDAGWVFDQGYGRWYLVAEERTVGARGLGSFAVAPRWARNLMLAAPHPRFDAITPEVAAAVMQELDGRALVVAGTHRCANAAPSPCDGTTSVCMGQYRVSDAAHDEASFVQAAHAAVPAATAAPLEIGRAHV